MPLRRLPVFCGLLLSRFLLPGPPLPCTSQDILATASGMRILTLRQQAEQINAWMETRLTSLLPELMRRTGIRTLPGAALSMAGRRSLS